MPCHLLCEYVSHFHLSNQLIYNLIFFLCIRTHSLRIQMFFLGSMFFDNIKFFIYVKAILTLINKLRDYEILKPDSQIVYFEIFN